MDGARATAATSRRTLRLGLVAVCALGSLVVVLGVPATAGAAGTALVAETFAGADVTSPASWTVPAGPTGHTNLACLTAGTVTSQSPIPGCSATAVDTTGNGVLRMTGSALNEEGGVMTTSSVPASNGLDATFDSYQYGGTGADGIGFVLAVENPATPTAPANIGQPGGDLGYAAGSSTSGTQGLAYGYLGVGLDVYGNYSNPVADGTGCGTSPSWADVTTPKQVVVRGPGNGTVGYCPLNSSLNGNPSTTQALGGGASSTRSASKVPVEVLINTTAAAATMTGTGYTAESVPAGDYGVAWTPIGGTAHFLLGALPTTADSGIPTGLYPSGWINPATGIPYQIGFGWVASTGSDTDYHEVSNAAVTSLQPVPVLTAAVSDNQGHDFSQGGSVTYTLTGGVAAGTAEANPITMSTTLPAGLTPGTATGTGWACTTAGQAVTCTHTGSVTGGTTLPAVTLPATVAHDASTTTGALTVAITVSSTDGDPANAGDVGTALLNTYTPLAPVRICDTRAGNPSALTGNQAQCNGTAGAGRRLAALTPLTVNLAGEFGVPTDATAAVVNITATGGTSQGYVTAFPAGAAAPTASNLNFPAGESVPNLVEVGLGTGGQISLISNQAVDVVVDLEGYVSPSLDGSPVSTTPCRARPASATPGPATLRRCPAATPSATGRPTPDTRWRPTRPTTCRSAGTAGYRPPGCRPSS